jgi:hypothetical protein
MIDVDSSGTQLRLIDMNDCTISRSMTIPGSTYGIGSGEGNVSDDGRLVPLSNGMRVYVADVQSGLVGPLFDASGCGQSDCMIDNVTISPKGRFLLVMQHDYQRVLDIDPATLALTPHAYPAVASAPGAAGVRVWQIMSRGRGPRTGRPPPAGVNVAYAPESVVEIFPAPDLERLQLDVQGSRRTDELAIVVLAVARIPDHRGTGQVGDGLSEERETFAG